MGVAEDLFKGAVDTIKKLGNSGQLIEVTQGDYDPDTTTRPKVETAHPIFYVMENLTYVVTETGVSGPKKCTLTIATDLEIKDEWYLITYYGEKFSFLDVPSTQVQDKTVIYTIQAQS